MLSIELCSDVGPQPRPPRTCGGASLDGVKLCDNIQNLVALFRPLCADLETLDEVGRMASDRAAWKDAHGLFRRIREKTLAAERTGEQTSAAQYLFEEVCAQSLYNLTRPADPFDPDTPHWVLLNAFGLAERLDEPNARVLQAVGAAPGTSLVGAP